MNYIRNLSISACDALFAPSTPDMTFISSWTNSKYVVKSKYFESSMDSPRWAKLNMIFEVAPNSGSSFGLWGWFGAFL